MSSCGLGHLVHRLLHGNALRFGVYCGVASVLIDLDHLPCLFEDPPIVECRFLHPLFLALGLVGSALFGGYVVKHLLKEKRENR